MTFKFNHLHVKTLDTQKTADWWVENLGAKIVGKAHGTGFKLDLDGIVFNVTTLVEDQVRQQHYGLEHIAIRTDDSSDVDKLIANGARVLEESEVVEDKMRVFFMETPEGVQLEVSVPK